MTPAKRRKDAYLRRITLLPIATVLLTSVVLAFRGSMPRTDPGFDLARGGGKPPHCDPSAPSVEIGSPEFWWRLAVSAVLVLVGGLFAGLTLGELSALGSSGQKQRQPGNRPNVTWSLNYWKPGTPGLPSWRFWNQKGPVILDVTR
jgi:hypothetical protein